MSLDGWHSIGVLDPGLASELEHGAKDRLHNHENEQNKAGSLTWSSMPVPRKDKQLTRWPSVKSSPESTRMTPL